MGIWLISLESNGWFNLADNRTPPFCNAWADEAARDSTDDRMKLRYKWLIATMAGAATMFVWGGVSHMVLPKGVGFSRMPNEERIVSSLRTSLPGDGLYFFPNLDLR